VDVGGRGRRDNIFMNDFAGSGRTNGNDTSSFIVIKDSNQAATRPTPCAPPSASREAAT
jgi:hypothetical protein